MVLCRLRYRLTLRISARSCSCAGFTVSYECIRQWAAKLLPVMGEALRRGRIGRSRCAAFVWVITRPFPHRSQVTRMNHDGKALNGSSRASLPAASGSSP